jgi:hypothetical protein
MSNLTTKLREHNVVEYIFKDRGKMARKNMTLLLRCLIHAGKNSKTLISEKGEQQDHEKGQLQIMFKV